MRALTVLDSYAEANQSTAWNIRDGHPSAADCSAAGQSFTALANYFLYSAQFWLKKNGTPVGGLTARLYAHSGTYGTSSVPTGAVLASSAEYNVAGLTVNYQLIEFVFPQPYYLLAGQTYCIDIEVSTEVTFNSSHYVIFGSDNTAPAHGGNCFRYNAGAWSANTQDACFYVNGILAGEGRLGKRKNTME